MFRTDITDNVLQSLQDSLAVLSPELMPIHERLVNVRRQLVALAAKETASQAAMVLKLHEQSTPTPADDGATEEMESKTPTKDMPHPEQIVLPKLKAELKPLTEELRKIDSFVLSLLFIFVNGS